MDFILLSLSLLRICSGNPRVLLHDVSATTPTFPHERGEHLFYRHLTLKDHQDDANDGPEIEDVQFMCSLQYEPGSCNELIQVWYHDINTKTCVPHVWYGCEGNGNRFFTLAACERTCGVYPETCRLPVEKGNGCKPEVTRYYFDSKEGVCKPFLYSGCNSNDNNFYSKPQCEESCVE